MVVAVTNLTDGPGQSPVQIDIWNKTLSPGDSLKLPAELVDSKLRGLEKRGLISIGPVPAWYDAFKTKRGIPIDKEEKAKRISPPIVPPIPMPAPSPPVFVVEEVTPTDEISFERRRKQR